MLVCHCRALSEREIRSTIRRGAHTFAQLVASCGAAGHCGGCRPLVEEILVEETSSAPCAEAHAAQPALLLAAAAA